MLLTIAYSIRDSLKLCYHDSADWWYSTTTNSPYFSSRVKDGKVSGIRKRVITESRIHEDREAGGLVCVSKGSIFCCRGLQAGGVSPLSLGKFFEEPVRPGTHNGEIRKVAEFLGFVRPKALIFPNSPNFNTKNFKFLTRLSFIKW